MAFPGSLSPSSIVIMKAHLTEIQAAEIGRKCGIMDRRPLDPPPVVCLQLFLVANAGTPMERVTEIADYDCVDCSGFVCEAELFAPHDPDESGVISPLFGDQFNPYGGASTSFNFVNCTQELVGSTFVTASVIEYGGRKCLVFPFADLSSKAIGDFCLRYKFFNINPNYQPVGLAGQRVQAQCWGNSFRVYSSKHAPPLKPSTDLTKILAKAGISVHQRKGRQKNSPQSVEFET
ncbi:velvet factor [Mycena albidolilacea]|uniref:Velvet factor n=1 Tax=Mycena albidolilacea TaxID=1033008 RepID=A0AAD7EVU2_9AGAR|nr:velvet factor [Mycena albidolilacea]